MPRRAKRNFQEPPTEQWNVYLAQKFTMEVWNLSSKNTADKLLLQSPKSNSYPICLMKFSQVWDWSAIRIKILILFYPMTYPMTVSQVWHCAVIHAKTMFLFCPMTFSQVWDMFLFSLMTFSQLWVWSVIQTQKFCFCSFWWSSLMSETGL